VRTHCRKDSSLKGGIFMIRNRLSLRFIAAVLSVAAYGMSAAQAQIRGTGAAGPGMAPATAPAGTAPTEGPTCPFDATIYELRLPPEQISRLDRDALSRAAGSVQDFEKALGAFGSIKPLYRANQSVHLAGDVVAIGTSTPYVTGSVANARGGVTNTVNYSNTGANFNIAGRASGGSRIELDLSVQISSLSDSSLNISNDVKAPIFRNSTMALKGMIQALQPFVMVSVDGANLDAEGKAVAFVARVTVGAAEPAAAAAPARGG
jgi:hypothetical protein